MWSTALGISSNQQPFTRSQGAITTNRRSQEAGRSAFELRSARFIREDRYVLVFALILLTIISTVLLADGTAGLVVTLALQSITLSLTLRTSDAGSRPRMLGELTSVAVFAGVAIMALTGNIGPARLAYAVSMLALAGITPYVIGRRILDHPVVNLNTIAGAANIYLLFGLFFAIVYNLIGWIMAHDTMTAAQAFFIGVRPVMNNDFVYYSFSTLTTVGYGDVVAANAFARMLSITEALIGQLYLVTVVALLVSNVGRTRKTAPPSQDSD